MDEIRLNRLVCPNGHDVHIIPETREAHCAACNQDYRIEELVPVPVSRKGFKPLHPPKVYGHPN